MLILNVNKYLSYLPFGFLVTINDFLENLKAKDGDLSWEVDEALECQRKLTALQDRGC